MFNLQNVFEKREEFQELCKDLGLYENGYESLISSKNREEFINIIIDNFNWINYCIEDFEPKFEDVSYFVGGYARVQVGGLFGFINTDCKIVIEPKFEAVYHFKNGYAQVVLENKIGIIKTDGSWLIEPIFDKLNYFIGGYARVQVGGLWGFIKTDYSYLVEPQFEYVYDFKDGSTFVKRNKTWYRMDINCNLYEVKE